MPQVWLRKLSLFKEGCGCAMSCFFFLVYPLVVFLLLTLILIGRKLLERRITKENERLRGFLNSLPTKDQACLPFEEDLSEETSEIRGLPCSAVMDEEDEGFC